MIVLESEKIYKYKVECDCCPHEDIVIVKEDEFEILYPAIISRIEKRGWKVTKTEGLAIHLQCKYCQNEHSIKKKKKVDIQNEIIQEVEMALSGESIKCL